MGWRGRPSRSKHSESSNMKPTSVPVVLDRDRSPPGGWKGWHMWMGNPPYHHTIVEAWRAEWERPAVVTVGADLAFNVANLYWRPIAEGGEPVH